MQDYLSLEYDMYGPRDMILDWPNHNLWVIYYDLFLKPTHDREWRENERD